MYIPPSFLCNDGDLILEWIKNESFGVFQTVDKNGVLYSTPLPFLVIEREHSLYLEAHIARANKHSEYLFKDLNNSLLIQGAHGYVSSRVYGHVNVPTYNYQVGIFNGVIEKMHDNELVIHLTNVVNQFEKGRENPMHWEEWPTELLDAYKKEIVGFRFIIEHHEVAFKLSQNRNDSDFDAITTDLGKGNMRQIELSKAMRNFVKR